MKIIIKKQKKAYEKWLKIVVVLGLFILGYFVMQPKVEIVERSTVEVPQVSEDVVRVKSEVFIHGFESYIKDIRWIDNQILVMKTNKGTQKDSEFEVDLDDLSVNLVNLDDFEVPTITINDMIIEHFAVLDESPTRALYYIDQEDLRGIYAYDGEGNYLFITNKMKVGSNEIPLIKLSENGNKMLYVEASTDRLVTYDFTTQKKKILSPVVTEKAFYENCILSPDGGYIIVIATDDTASFSCYGADSGKLYVDKIEGIDPNFSRESDRLYYFYTGDMTSDFTGQRLGVVTLDKRNIAYLTSNSDEVFFKRMLPVENNQLIYLVGINENDYFIIDQVVIYSPETNEKKSISALKGMQIHKDCNFDINGQIFLLPEADNQLTLLNLETQAVQNFYDLTRLSQDALYIKNSEGFLLGYGNTIYRINQNGKSMIYQYEGTYVDSSISPEGDKMLIVSQDEEEFNCVITFKLGINY
ncbi:hypothetical protein [Fusibacter ferrireducens]|uniref:Uncharacterized protein n=1 Tax=Fusibacter ferrireducens TaxID=2785058 RepID=A0ABR9ZWS8_9FIRM|nr:hypothetical protein [Fusibacter ferrireducens]MBF4694901.1 hypothetical protein [Fusibacter ferrireducens]